MRRLRGCLLALTWTALLGGCQTYGPLVDTCTHDKGDPSLARELARLARDSDDPLKILVLSGGGRNGAYGAGFLRGLAARGDVEMKYDIVTGVSTGALQGTFAFLGRRGEGSSDYERLSELYRNVDNRDVYRLRVLPFRKSFYRTRPLGRLLNEKITDADIAAVAAETHRRFYVGTLDLAESNVKVHDMGCIARTHPPDYYRKVLLASASIPAIFPSVEVKNSLQVDGGVRDQALLERSMAELTPTPSLTVIVNMPLVMVQKPAKKGLLFAAVRAAYVMMNEGLLTDIALIRDVVPTAKVKHIPANAMDEAEPIEFDTQIMRSLESLGYEEATLSPIPWDYD